MPILKNIPSKRIINGIEVESSEGIILSEKIYVTKGEHIIIVKNVDDCEITLDSSTTDHVYIKSLTKTIIKPDRNKFDDKYDDIELNSGSSVEFYFIGGYWFILSSDGIKYQ